MTPSHCFPKKERSRGAYRLKEGFQAVNPCKRADGKVLYVKSYDILLLYQKGSLKKEGQIKGDIFPYRAIEKDLKRIG